ncbi:MAG TPA: glycosyltransferase family 9 protein [Bryobacteraceae bacterium]|nr:glycosyltransferase family 9 protein [Bryobacteraceae bacterium]
MAEQPWPQHLLDELLAQGGDRELFRVVVEGLADQFEPRLCRVYAELFCGVVAKRTGLHADHLLARYERVRRPRSFDRDPASIQNVFVLSRITLGADVAVTSIVLDAAKQRFPDATIWFAGPAKNWELFAADPRLRHLPIAYGRAGSIDDRLSVWPQLREAASRPSSIVIDPDSRLTQLGLLPICPEEDYYFFESRSYGRGGDQPLPLLTQRWVSETFGVSETRAYVSSGVSGAQFATTISFGVGENPAKRVPAPFEEEVLRRLPRPILIDKGAGGEEAERVERAVSIAGSDGITMWDGSFASFAAHIQHSKLFVGYDSAGGHVAAACGVPMISIFSGAVSERMFERWRPTGPGRIEIIRPATTGLAKLLDVFDHRLLRIRTDPPAPSANPETGS